MSLAAKARRLESRGLSAFEQAHGDLLEAHRIQSEAANLKRDVARQAALEAESLRSQAQRNLERADRLAGFLAL